MICPKRRSGRSGEKKYLLTLTGIKPQSLGHTARILAILPRLHLKKSVLIKESPLPLSGFSQGRNVQTRRCQTAWESGQRYTK
jgi:hypothetical protein